MVTQRLQLFKKISIASFSLLLTLAAPLSAVFAEGFNQRADYTAWLQEHEYWRVQHPDYAAQMIYDAPIGKSPSIGPTNAKVTLVEFVDFSDSYSQQLAVGCHSLMMKYPGKVRIVFKNYPNPRSANSMTEHKVAMAALLQNQFWPVYSRLFLMPAENTRDEATYLRWAKELHLDVDKFQRDRNSSEVARLIESDLADARSCKMTLGAPKFFLNGRRVTTPKSMQELANGVEYELLEAK